ncbi:MAG: (d)CMP kinase [Clostridia bacterium]|nr:(d)CMP kinase [Clostridia bacterium]
MEHFNVALDGPSGSGKSTAAKAVSGKLNILYLDTGAMYRATALKAIKCGVDCLDEEGVKKFIDDIDIKIEYRDGSQHTLLDGEDVSLKIRENHVSMKASDISSLKCVRLKMVELQRKIASEMSCVLDGRDIGSFVLPDAKFKFYITADADVRARRRQKELAERGQTVDFETLKKEIEQRDYNDSHREFAPLKRADDAILIDTSDMSAEEVAEKILGVIGASNVL